MRNENDYIPKKIEMRKDLKNTTLIAINAYLIKSTFTINCIFNDEKEIADKFDIIMFVIIRWTSPITIKFNMTTFRLSIKIWDFFKMEFTKKNFKKRILTKYVINLIVRVNKKESECYELRLLQIKEFKIFGKIINIKIKQI